MPTTGRTGLVHMQIETIVVGEFQVNCFIMVGEGNEAIVIDPGKDPDIIASFIKQNGLSVAAYLLTHGHVDHVSGIADLHDEFPAPVALHGDDLKWAFTETNGALPFYPAPRAPSEVSRVLADGQELADAGLTYRVVSTPGHTPGSVCFLFVDHDILITGDTLFAGSVGRTDLPGGNSRVLSQSLKKLAGLPDRLKVLPGHGASSDMATEKRTNYFMQSFQV